MLGKEFSYQSFAGKNPNDQKDEQGGSGAPRTTGNTQTQSPGAERPVHPPRQSRPAAASAARVRPLGSALLRSRIIRGEELLNHAAKGER